MIPVFNRARLLFFLPLIFLCLNSCDFKPGPDPDITAPLVTIISPAPGAELNGIIIISGTASDNSGINEILVTVNGTKINITGREQWSGQFDTSLLFKTSVEITAAAVDTSGNTSGAAGVECSAMNTGTYISIDNGIVYVKPSSRDDSYNIINEAVVAAREYNINKILAAKGVYLVSEPVVLFDGLCLLGGYDAATWERNVPANETIIRDNRLTTAVFQADYLYYYTIGFEENAGVNTVIDGFSLYGCRGDKAGVQPGSLQNRARPVVIYGKSAAPSITNNRIYCGFADYPSGIRFNTDANPQILNNEIILPDNLADTRCYAVLLSGNSSGTVRSNTIKLGSGTGEHMGIFIEKCNGTEIKNNFISGSDGFAAQGIFIDSSADVSLASNTIDFNNFAKHSAKATFGMEINGDCPGLWIYNNTISIDYNEEFAMGIHIVSCSFLVRIDGNKVVMGSTVSKAWENAVTVYGSKVNISNNILMSGLIDNNFSYTGVIEMINADAVISKNMIKAADVYNSSAIKTMGIYSCNGRGIIEKNVICLGNEEKPSDTSVYGIYLENNDTDTASKETIIRNNVIDGQNGKNQYMYSILANDSCNSVKITNNTLYTGYCAGRAVNIALWKGQPDSIIVNNLMASHSDTRSLGLWVDTDFAAINNCLFHNISKPIVTSNTQPPGYASSGNLETSNSGEILFSGAIPFYPAAGSLLVNSGMTSGGPAYGSVTDDIDGVLRPFGAAYDIGAYEYQE